MLPYRDTSPGNASTTSDGIIMVGNLMKQSPARMKFGQFQSRTVTLKAVGQLTWSLPTGEHRGSLDLRKNPAVVEADEKFPSRFCLRPARDKWSEGTFTGVNSNRVFCFDAQDSDARAAWCKALHSQIEQALSSEAALEDALYAPPVTDLDRGKPICVTGASGYIAMFVVRDLLARGWRVNGTVRDLSKADKIEPLRALPGAPDKLTLFEADLIGEQVGFESAISGCCACIHTATPVTISPDGQQKMTAEEIKDKQMKPALDGFQKIIDACVRVGIKRFVLTSTMGAMVTHKPPGPSLIDESCWSDESLLEDSIMTAPQSAYNLSKVRQEKLAWNLAKEHNLEMRTINPSFVFGPRLPEHLSIAHDVLLSVLQGDGNPLIPLAPEGYLQNAVLGIVDVREVSLAHVLAVEKPDAEGRYLLKSGGPNLAAIGQLVQERLPEYAKVLGGCSMEVAGSTESGFQAAASVPWSSAKVRALGVPELRWEDSILASVQALKELQRLHLPATKENLKRTSVFLHSR